MRTVPGNETGSRGIMTSAAGFGISGFLGGGIENMLDMRYRPYSSGIVAAGRNYSIALRASM